MSDVLPIVEPDGDFDSLVLPVTCPKCGGRLTMVDDGSGTSTQRGEPGRSWARIVIVQCVRQDCHMSWSLHVDIGSVA